MADGYVEISPAALARFAADPAAPAFAKWVHSLDPAGHADLTRFLTDGEHADPGPVWHQLQEALRSNPPPDKLVAKLAYSILTMLEPHDGRHPQDETYGEIAECAARGDHPPEN